MLECLNPGEENVSALVARTGFGLGGGGIIGGGGGGGGAPPPAAARGGETQSCAAGVTMAGGGGAGGGAPPVGVATATPGRGGGGGGTLFEGILAGNDGDLGRLLITVSSYSTILFSFFTTAGDLRKSIGTEEGVSDFGGRGGRKGGVGDCSFEGRGGADNAETSLGTGRGGRVLLEEDVEEEGDGPGRCWLPPTRGGRGGLLATN